MGTASLTLPIPVSAARSGFSPQLSLSYNSGAGNGPFGLGWSVPTPTITRKTDKGLPRYQDAEDSDVYILSGSEDLMPVLLSDGEDAWREDSFERNGYQVRRYRPRIEGLFARIERWTRLEDGDIHWRSIAKDNLLTVYGHSPESRIADPANPRHVFSWLISQSYDDVGNAIFYDYVPEDDRSVDLTRANERQRVRTANRYLKRVRYGNRRPLARGSPGGEADWMFEVVFDYGEGHYRQEPPDEHGEVFSEATTESAADAAWPVRADPFSTYRSGFEVRSYRLCRRVLMFHHFPEELGAESSLVRSTECAYCEKSIGSFLTRAIQAGYSPRGRNRYLKKTLPPLELAYSTSPLEDASYGRYELKQADASNLPAGIDGTQYRWVDLDGEGIAGVLAEADRSWYYQRNLGGGHFAAPEVVVRKPSIAVLASGKQQLLDVNGDGLLDLVDLEADAPGFHERAPGGRWEPFRTFRGLPVLDWDDPNVKFVDLTGDGIADILVTEDRAFYWHPSYLRDGYGAGVRVPAPHDEEKGPRVVFDDGTQSIYLADMTGDGLNDIARLRNGEICYWPNLGYGRFGPKVTMDASPRFAATDVFDQKRVRLADTDGSGTTDIVYLGADAIHVYLNECGNRWSDRRTLEGVPIGDLTEISVADFLGRGTACIVWSSPLPSDARRPLRYVDLMHGCKPHLLVRVGNNLGAETVIEYASSTEFYLADRAAGMPWVTRLPFPVHVVKRTEVHDHVSRHRFVTQKTYHHGYFDGVEREFRGFGRVDQLDTEEFDRADGEQARPAADNLDRAWTVPPVLTKTWFHTGVFLGGDRISRHLAHEYYHEPDEGPEMLLDDTILPESVPPAEAREACRSLKGTTLRQEVYALDHSEESPRPYTVAESNATIRLVQPRAWNRYAVFFTHARESLSCNYERKLYEVGGVRRADPRVTHALTLRVDAYGNVLRSASIGYGRRHAECSGLPDDPDRRKQTATLLTLTESDYTNAVLEPDAYRGPLPFEARSYELLNFHPDARRSEATCLFRYRELEQKIAVASDGRHDLPYEDLDGAGVSGAAGWRRLVQRTRTLYRSDDLTRLLAPGRVQAMALPGASYKLAYTPGLLAAVYRRHRPGQLPEDLLPDPKAILGEEGRYVDLDRDGHWWVPSGRVFYSPDPAAGAAEELGYARAHFFLPHRFEDLFGNVSAVKYDSHDLLLVESRDPVHNVVRAANDYRVLAPVRVTDANENRMAAAFDALGLLVGTAVMGKKGERQGDSLEGFVADPGEAVVLAHLSDPFADPHAILGRATTRILYDVYSFMRSREEEQPQPAVSYALARETHVADLAPGQQSRIQHAFSYTDGFARVVQKKVQAGPGPVEKNGPDVTHRWIGSGWTIFNNKGKPVRQYEPFFNATQRFEYAKRVGVSPTLFYDPLGRVVATLHPEHTFEKIVFDPWQQESWDANDTTGLDPARDETAGSFLRRLPDDDYLPTWYDLRRDGGLGPRARDAAEKAMVHADTPTTTFFDSLGRAFLTVATNRFERAGTVVEERYLTRTELDIEGQQRWITDALGRRIGVYAYDLLGTKIHGKSADAGDRWTVNDASGKPLLAWDSRKYRLRCGYDALRRPTELFVRTDTGGEILAESTVYGEGQVDDRARNLRGKPFQQRDNAGVVTSVAYDFKGNLLSSTRQLRRDYKDEADWSQSPALEKPEFTSSTSYDTLNRPTTLTAPDASVIRPGYDEAGLLKDIHVNLRGAPEPTPFVRDIRYNARGQREFIEHGNHARTIYAYDPLTYRLARLRTTRRGDHAVLQDLNYTDDPVGNISAIADRAQQTFYFDNQVVSASNDYVYDATYRLIGAKGRELIGLASEPGRDWDDSPRMDQPLPGDGQAMRRYHESYVYDAVGNILEMIHHAADQGWRRYYGYQKSSNRLDRTRSGQIEEHYRYDANGNLTHAPHLQAMEWDYKNRLRLTQAQAVREGIGERTYYVYDSSGQRVRKITERANGSKKSARTYLGGFELYREYHGEDITLERETLHVMDDKRRVALVETRTVDRDAPPDARPRTLIRYQFTNHLDSSCLELDDKAAIISYEEYSPFGSTSYEAVRRGVEVSPKRYRYTGEERDEENGFYSCGARYYAPWLGRWTAPDPKGMVDGTNLYAYCRNNPVGMRDPNGTEGEEVQSKEETYAESIDPTTGADERYTSTPDLEAREYVSFPDDSITVARPGASKATSTAPGAKAPPPAQAASPSGSPATPDAPTVPPASSPKADPANAPATAGEAGKSFAKGFVKGAVIGVGLVALGSVGTVIGIGLLAYGGYKLATGGYKDVAAATDRLVSGNGTSHDYEALGGIVGGVAAGGAAGIAKRGMVGAGGGAAGGEGGLAGGEGGAAGGEGGAAGGEGGAAQAESRAALLAQLKLRARQVELGTDPARGFIESEGAGGVHIEQALGRTIARSADPAADFVDSVLGPISLKGPIPPAGSVEGLANSAVKDALFNTATKALVVDLTGLSAEHAAFVRAAVAAGTSTAQKTILFVP